MNVSVYFYDEEGYYLFTEMTPLEYDEEGRQIVPEGATNVFPLPLSTYPRFDKEKNIWVKTVEEEPAAPYVPEPTLEEKLRKEIEDIREEMLKTQKEFEETKALVKELRTQSKRSWEIAQKLQYGLIINFPQCKHYFE